MNAIKNLWRIILRETESNLQSEEELGAEQNKPYEALIVLGGGWKLEFRGKQLGADSKMRVLAAGEMFKQGLVSQIILSGGKIAGEDKPSLAHGMKEYLMEKFPNISENSILIEDKSRDTSENAQNTLGLMIKNNIQSAALLTSAAHLKRAARIFHNFGLDVQQGFSAEQELQRRSKRYEKFVQRLAGSRGIKKSRMREHILNGLLTIDPKARIPRLLAQKTRK